MDGRTRKVGLAGLVIGATLGLAVGLAGAQGSSDHLAPKPVPVTVTAPDQGSPGQACSDAGEETTEPTPDIAAQL
jgi:ABC-type glycerol-3-phosphate transport system substrate-binding protein